MVEHYSPYPFPFTCCRPIRVDENGDPMTADQESGPGAPDARLLALQEAMTGKKVSSSGDSDDPKRASVIRAVEATDHAIAVEMRKGGDTWDHTLIPDAQAIGFTFRDLSRKERDLYCPKFHSRQPDEDLVWRCENWDHGGGAGPRRWRCWLVRKRSADTLDSSDGSSSPSSTEESQGGGKEQHMEKGKETKDSAESSRAKAPVTS